MIKKTGRIIPNGVKLEMHEYNTILYFTELGKDVELIIPSNTPYNRRPDIIMDGIEWEIKCPIGTNHRNIERIFYRACLQADNIIVDLRSFKGKNQVAVTVLEKCFTNTRRARRLYVITKTSELKFYKK